MPRHTTPEAHPDIHYVHKSGWLRAAVLGANDGLISTSGLLVGMVATGASTNTLLLTAAAGLTAGAFSMAAGEYVSVSSQADSEKADRDKEKIELDKEPDVELLELVGIYQRRGLSEELATQVANELTAHNALNAHLQDELGIHENNAARPLQAALASAGAFAAGALCPILVVLLCSGPGLEAALVISTLLVLGLLGALGAKLGGAPLKPGATRVLFWGALAMGASALIGRLFGASVGM
ncbi:VIT1/CCC1 transporter family protein [Ottowia thiooxydans]|uniref:VIT1/CCC1 family predicted Fe2+/Mn2+ transporter n=1 Tax=Ottowia thiooxydans TaxID=219182 RepID=A0ABV2QBR1_9BURK